METVQPISVYIDLKHVQLKGMLTIPNGPKGIVISSQGSGSSYLSSRNKYIASNLNSHKFGTLLFDLLTEGEDLYIENRFDIDLLTHRLIQTSEWIAEKTETTNLPLAFFWSKYMSGLSFTSTDLSGKAD